MTNTLMASKIITRKRYTLSVKMIKTKNGMNTIKNVMI